MSCREPYNDIWHSSRRSHASKYTYFKPRVFRYWPINLTASLSWLARIRWSFFRVSAKEVPLETIDVSPFCNCEPFAWCMTLSTSSVPPTPGELLWVWVWPKQLIDDEKRALFVGGGEFPPMSEPELDARLALKTIWFVLSHSQTRITSREQNKCKLIVKVIMKPRPKIITQPKAFVYYDAWRHNYDP